ncbi:MAG: SPOR domain-containing protein [Halioglobus sp.]
MSDRDDDHNKEESGNQQEDNWNRNENLFSDFEEEADYEDSDRDSDFAAIYTEIEEDEAEELDPEPVDPAPEDNTWELEEEKPELDEDNPWGQSDEENEEFTEPDLWDAEPNPPGAFDDEPPTPEGILPPIAAPTEPAEEYLEDDPEEEWDEIDDEYEEEEARELNVSLGMIIVAVFALVLLGAGGYGVIEQRASMQEEIRQLQAKLATSAPPQEVTASRASAAQANERNVQLQGQLDELLRENSNLQAIVTGLEKQLTAQQEVLQKPAPAPKATPQPATPQPAAPTPAAPKPATPTSTSSNTTTATGWFVNFSSYTKRTTADSWVSKLQPATGRVTVSTGQSGGRTVYRVRVVELPDRSTAESVARALEKEYGLSKLWIGKSG